MASVREEDPPIASHSTRAYVGNLDFSTSWQDLKDHFRPAGEVVFADVMKDSHGRSKGCGIVEFRTAAECIAAIRLLHDTRLASRLIFVREDREDHKMKGKRRGGGGRQLFVGNLHYGVSWQQLKDRFKVCGRIARADILLHPDGRPKGAGSVTFVSDVDAKRAIEMLNNTEFQGRFIDVRYDKYG